MITIPELDPTAIRAACDRIDPAFLGSPQYVHEGLSGRLGVPVIVKVETVNPIRSFKGRGTWLAVHGLAGEGRIGADRPILCVSAGNFGQGVAYAARALGIPAVVFVSRHANRGKVGRMRALGAEVIEPSASRSLPVVWIPETLWLEVKPIRVERVDDRRWRFGAAPVIEVDDDGLPVSADGAIWPLEDV